LEGTTNHKDSLTLQDKSKQPLKRKTNQWKYS